MWINISMKSQIISIVIFIYIYVFAECFTNRTEADFYLTFVVIPFK